MTIRVPESRCVNCGTQLDSVTQVGEKGESRAADRPTEQESWFTVCIRCGHLMAVNPDLTLRELTDAEQIGIAGDRRLVAINKYRGKVKRKPMTKKANYSEFMTLPAWTRAVWIGDGEVQNEADPYKWGGKADPPAIGARIAAHVNQFGAGTVVSYFVEYGWLGVIVKFDDPPEWYVKQNKGNPPGHLFGVDLEPRS